MTEHTSVHSLIDGQNIISLPPDTTVRAATKVMAKHKIGAVPVTESGRLIGIFTERDLISRVIAREADPDATRLRDVMTPHPQTIDVAESAGKALQMMRDGGFRHLPVTQKGQLLGIVSIRDIPPEEWSVDP
jgi:CBS domain-containing protein